MEDGFKATLSPQFSKTNISHVIDLSRWRPTREEIGLKHVPVMTGDLVKIGSIRQTNKCYIIPVDDAINEQRLEFLSKVAIHCKHGECKSHLVLGVDRLKIEIRYSYSCVRFLAKSIENELKLNEIVGVPHAKSYYRAQVTERKKTAYMVHILDTGEETKIHKTDIKPLPDPLKFVSVLSIYLCVDSSLFFAIFNGFISVSGRLLCDLCSAS